jgi:hypothetical protein
MGGVSMVRESDTSWVGPGQPREKERTVSLIEIDAATLARVIREQKALPITDGEAESLARALEASNDEEEFLANTLATVRFLADRLEPSTTNAVKRADSIG